MGQKMLMKGNEAIAEAAIQAGCRFFFGYPITPQNQIPEYMSKRMPKVGKEVITPDGPGVVWDLNIIKETVRVRIQKGDSSELKDYPVEDVQRLAKANTYGAIIGKAYYTGAIDLRKAIEVAR